MDKAATLQTLMTLAALRDAVHQAEVTDPTTISDDDLQYAVISVYVALGFSKDESLIVYNHSCQRVGDHFTRMVKEFANDHG